MKDYTNDFFAKGIPLELDVLDKELTPTFEKIKKETEYLLARESILWVLKLSLAFLKRKMSEGVVDLWKYDSTFKPLWELVSLEDITKLSEKYMLNESMHNQEELSPITDEENITKAKRELLLKFHHLMSRYPQFHFTEVSMVTPLEHLQQLYQMYLDKIHDLQTYEHMKITIILGMITGNQIMKNFLPTEIYTQARQDPELRGLWSIVDNPIFD